MLKRLFTALLLTAAAIVSAKDPYKLGIVAEQKKDCIIAAMLDTKTQMPRKLFFNTKTKLLIAPGKDLPAAVNVFFVERGGKIALIDAGYGAFHTRMHYLNLKENNIDFVMLTHVHPDHIGGLLKNNELPAFSKAIIYLSQEEAAALKNPEYKMHAPWKKIEKAYHGRIRSFDKKTELPCGITAIPAPGHTPGHTVFHTTMLLAEGGVRHVYFIGDLIHGAAVQFATPEVCAKYDHDPAMAVKSRRAILEMTAKENIVTLDLGNALIPNRIYGAHLPFPGYGAVRKKDAGFEYVPVEF